MRALSGSERASLRRLDARSVTRAVALVHVHGRFQTVRIVDFSSGGLQLQGCFGVGVGDAVVVELLSAHRLEAKVAWAIGSRLGVRFLQPMGLDHPALMVLQQATRPGLGLGASDQTAGQLSSDE